MSLTCMTLMKVQPGQEAHQKRKNPSLQRAESQILMSKGGKAKVRNSGSSEHWHFSFM